MLPRTSRATAWLAILTVVVFVAVTAYVAHHHELWRDEVRALNIVAGAHSIGGLFDLLRNEGHPPLWYLILYSAYGLTHSVLVLKPISIACAAGAVWVLARYAPFPAWQRVLFAIGAYPIYEYSVICRNYGISMLLLFVVAALYKRRFVHPLRFAAALALLANTNAFAFIIAGAIAVSFAGEARALVEPPRRLRAAAGLAIVIVGMLAAGWVMRPDATSIVSTIHAKTFGDVVAVFGRAVPGAGSLLGVLTGGVGALGQLLFWAATAYFITRPWLLVIWAGSAFAFATFSALVYPADPFQIGLLYILLIVLLWIDSPRERKPKKPIVWAREGVLAALLISQAWFGVTMSHRDIVAPISSSESLGRYLTSHTAFRDAIVIGEPDVVLESLPYYAPNRIYLPRENKDLVKVNLTTASRASLSLDDLLATAERLHQETGKQVLLVMGNPLSPYGPFSIRYPYGREFTYTVDALQRLDSRAIVLEVFDKSVSDENYLLFRFL